MEALDILYMAYVACVASCYVNRYQVSEAGPQGVRIAVAGIAYGRMVRQLFRDRLTAAVTGGAREIGCCIFYVQAVKFCSVTGSAVVAAFYVLCQVSRLYMAEFAVYVLTGYLFEYWYMDFFFCSYILEIKDICCPCEIDNTRSEEYACQRH